MTITKIKTIDKGMQFGFGDKLVERCKRAHFKTVLKEIQRKIL